jgi:peptidoglycan hydrolase CwlO-like protein
MGEDQGQVGTPVEQQQKSPEELKREIEATREGLGDTAAALAEKTDVKTRAREKVEAVKQTVAEKKASLTSSSSSGGSGAGNPTAAAASSAATQAKAKAQENPVAAAAIGAFVGGFLLGRVTSR